MANLAKIGFGILLTVIGLIGGRFLAGNPAPEPEEHAHAGPPGSCACENAAIPGAGGGSGEPTVLPPQTIKNIGVVVEPAMRSAVYHRTRDVQAAIVDRPLNRRPMVAPFGGVVTTVHIKTSEIVQAGQTLVRVARDSIPRPMPALTASLLDPVAEAVHEATRTLRTAVAQRDVTKRELDRILPFVENRTIPRKTAIDLEYGVAREEQSAEIARAELRNHGLSAEEIAELEAGALPPSTVRLWQRVLERNGLWGEIADAILLTIPEMQRNLPWSVAAVGELASAGLVTPELATLLKELPHASAHFADMAGLLLQGTPLSTVELLARQGALEPQMTIQAPEQRFAHLPPDWDVERIHVRPGQRVVAGEILVTLYDARSMWLELEPVGREIGLVRDAIERGETLRARPLVPDSGLDLPSVQLRGMVLQGEAARRGATAYAQVDNVSLQCEDDRPCRSWQLRVGLRYIVGVPVDRHENVFVLPAAALTAIGPDKIVFVENGDTFRRQPVHVLYADDVLTVIADDGSLFQGDPVVQSGAFALGLALNQDPGQSVAEHGHAHQ